MLKEYLILGLIEEASVYVIKKGAIDTAECLT